MKEAAADNKDEEKKEGEEEVKEVNTSSEESDVPLSEEFQREAMEIVECCKTKEQCSFVRDLIYKKEDEMRQAEMKKKGKNSVPSEYSLSEMPS